MSDSTRGPIARLGYTHFRGGSDRIINLCKAVVALAMEQRVEVAIYPHKEIQNRFGGVGARTRQDIAEAVARSFEELKPRLPKPRRAWDGPDRRMAIFDAAAAVQAHYQVEASSLIGGILAD